MVLLTGETIIPRNEVTQLSQPDNSQRFLVECESQEPWTSLTDNARSFLRALLVLEPSQRLTASEALLHAWYREPVAEAMELEKAYERIRKSWQCRDEGHKVIEHLRIDKHSASLADSQQPCESSKMANSPYFLNEIVADLRSRDDSDRRIETQH